MLQHEIKSIGIGEATHQLVEKIERFSKNAPEGYWGYEYQGHCTSKSVFIVTFVNGEITGTQGVVPYYLNVNGEVFLTGRSERTLLDNSLRGKDVFSEMMDLCVSKASEKGISFIWGFTKNKKAFKNQGFNYFDGYFESSLFCLHPFRDARLLTKNIDQNILIKLFMALYNKIAFGVLECVDSFFKYLPKIKVQSNINQAADINDLYSNIGKTRKKSNLIFIQQDSAFRDWLLKGAKKPYLTYYAYQDFKLSAYLYCDISNPPYAIIKDAAAIDFFSLYAILRKLKSDLKHSEIIYIRAAYNFKNKTIKKLALYFYCMGFIPVYRGGGFVIRPLLYKNLNLLYDISSWYITPMWSDLFNKSKKNE